MFRAPSAPSRGQLAARRVQVELPPGRGARLQASSFRLAANESGFKTLDSRMIALSDD